MSRVVIVGGVFREILIGAGRREIRLAGSGLYAATSAAHAGADTMLIAPIGIDDIPTADEICAGYGISTQWLPVGADSGTFVVDREWWRAPRPQYKPVGSPETEPEGSASCEVLLVLGHPEWRPEQCCAVREMAARARFLWDRQGWLSRSPDLLPDIAGAQETILLANLGEICELMDISPIEAENLDSTLMARQAAVIKDGPWGVHLFQAGQRAQRINAYDVVPRDILGTGDVFAGALAAALVAGDDLQDACMKASLASATAMTSHDPLAPQALQNPRKRPVVLPSVRADFTVTVAAADRWAAQILAAEVRELGLVAEGEAGGQSGVIGLQVSDGAEGSNEMIIHAADTANVVESVVNGVLALVTAQVEPLGSVTRSASRTWGSCFQA